MEVLEKWPDSFKGLQFYRTDKELRSLEVIWLLLELQTSKIVQPVFQNFNIRQLFGSDMVTVSIVYPYR